LEGLAQQPHHPARAKRTQLGVDLSCSGSSHSWSSSSPLLRIGKSIRS
jgi:hypothetical protein